VEEQGILEFLTQTYGPRSPRVLFEYDIHCTSKISAIYLKKTFLKTAMLYTTGEYIIYKNI